MMCFNPTKRINESLDKARAALVYRKFLIAAHDVKGKMMFSKYVIMSCDEDSLDGIVYAYYTDIESARKGFEHILKYYPDEGYQLYEYIPTRIE